MTDIVQQLRERGDWSDGGKVWEQDALCAGAATEIERLRKLLISAAAVLAMHHPYQARKITESLEHERI